MSSLTDRQEQALVALYRARAFGFDSRKTVRALVQHGYLTDSRYAGPLAALGDRGLVENRHPLLNGNWSPGTDWWLTDQGRVAAYAVW